MRKNQTIILLFITLFTISTSDICSEIKGQNFYIRQAFLLDDFLVVFTSGNTVYRLIEFKFTNVFTHSSIDEETNWNEWQTKLKYIFPINYPKEGKRIAAITWDKREGIEQLVCSLYQFDGSVAHVVDVKEINLNIYKYVPKEEPLNLYSMFTKLPQKDIVSNLKSVMNFPLNEPTVVQRMFAYYLETPQKNTSSNPNVLKRHIFMEKNTTTDGTTELNWVYDTPSKMCIPSNVIVNASIAVTDYTRNGNDLNFLILEFSGKEFFLRDVTIKNNIVSPDLKTLSTGPLDWVFGCSAMPTVSTTTTTPTTFNPIIGLTDSDGNPLTPHETPPGTGQTGSDGVSDGSNTSSDLTPESSEGISLWIWVLLFIVIIVIICVIVFMVYWFLIKSKTPPPVEEGAKGETNKADDKTGKSLEVERSKNSTFRPYPGNTGSGVISAGASPTSKTASGVKGASTSPTGNTGPGVKGASAAPTFSPTATVTASPTASPRSNIGGTGGKQQ